MLIFPQFVPVASGGATRTLGSQTAFSGGTASQESTYLGNATNYGAENAVDGLTGTSAGHYCQASGTKDSSYWWQYDFGSGNAKMLGSILQYYKGGALIPSSIETFNLKASNTGAFAGEETTIVSNGDFNLTTADAYHEVTWADSGGTYRYWRLESLSLVSTVNGNRPIVVELQYKEYT
jgi:hypothetical protein